MKKNENVEVREEATPFQDREVPYACEFNCRGGYDEGGFACHKAQTCEQFGRF